MISLLDESQVRDRCLMDYLLELSTHGQVYKHKKIIMIIIIIIIMSLFSEY